MPFTKKLWRRKFFHGPRRLLRNQITSFNRTQRRHTQDWLDANMSFWPKDFWPHNHQIEAFSLQLVDTLWGKGLHDTPNQYTDELKTYVNDAWRSVSSGILQNFQPRLARVLPPKVVTFNNLMSLGINKFLTYKTKHNKIFAKPSMFHFLTLALFFTKKNYLLIII